MSVFLVGMFAIQISNMPYLIFPIFSFKNVCLQSRGRKYQKLSSITNFSVIKNLAKWKNIAYGEEGLIKKGKKTFSSKEDLSQDSFL